MPICGCGNLHNRQTEKQLPYSAHCYAKKKFFKLPKRTSPQHECNPVTRLIPPPTQLEPVVSDEITMNSVSSHRRIVASSHKRTSVASTQTPRVRNAIHPDNCMRTLAPRFPHSKRSNLHTDRKSMDRKSAQLSVEAGRPQLLYCTILREREFVLCDTIN